MLKRIAQSNRRASIAGRIRALFEWVIDVKPGLNIQIYRYYIT